MVDTVDVITARDPLMPNPKPKLRLTDITAVDTVMDTAVDTADTVTVSPDTATPDSPVLARGPLMLMPKLTDTTAVVTDTVTDVVTATAATDVTTVKSEDSVTKCFKFFLCKIPKLKIQIKK